MNENTSHSDRSFAGRRARATVLLFVGAVWCTIVIARLAHLMIFSRTRILEEISQESVVTGRIAPMRGRILDRNSVPLAWSVRKFCLKLTIPETEEDIKQLVKTLSLIPEFSFLDLHSLYLQRGKTLVVKDDLTPEEVGLYELIRKPDELRTVSYLTREYFPDPNMKRKLGSVVSRNGLLIGVSGVEKAHDTLLRGCPGVYRVMVDKEGGWMPESWEKISDLRAGYDVYLPLSVTNHTGAG